MPNLTRAAYRRLFLDDNGNWTPDGALVLADLEAICYALRTSVPDASGPIDPLRLVYNEGSRRAYLHIKRQALTPEEDETT